MGRRGAADHVGVPGEWLLFWLYFMDSSHKIRRSFILAAGGKL